MKTLADLIEDREQSTGLHVIAWGYGRMRPGTILSIGPKNARVRLQQNRRERTSYQKTLPHGEVFIVEGDDAEYVATWVNSQSEMWEKGARRPTISSTEAYIQAHEYQS